MPELVTETVANLVVETVAEGGAAGDDHDGYHPSCTLRYSVGIRLESAEVGVFGWSVFGKHTLSLIYAAVLSERFRTPA